MPNLEDITAPEYIDIASGVEGASKKFSTEVDPDMSALLKSLASKNITLSQWNAAVTQLGLTVADVRRTYGILKKVAEDLDSNLAATNDVTADLISAVQKTYIELDAIAEDHEQRIADEETKSADHDKRLEDIEEYISDMPVEDKSAAYRKLVPIKSRSKADVLSVGGMTYKCNNIIKSPYESGSFESGGVAFTVNGDGTILINGENTSGENINFYFCGKDTARTNLTADTYTISGLPSELSSDGNIRIRVLWYANDGVEAGSFETSGTPSTKTIGASSSVILLYVRAGAVANNVLVKPMLNRGAGALPYEPYFAGLRHTKVTEIRSDGTNFIPFPYVTKSETMGAGYTTTNNGITFTVLGDGRVMGNGTATGNARLSLVRNFALPKGVFRISGGVTVDGVRSKAYIVVTAGLNDTWVAESTNIGAGKFDLTACKYNNNDIYLMVLNGTTLNNAIFEPMVSFYQEATLPYKPYRADNPIGTLAIPEAVQAIDGYGVGINADCHNYLEFVDGKVLYHKVCGERIFNGTEYFHLNIFLQSRGRNAYQTAVIGLKGDQEPLCNSFESLKWSQNSDTAVNSMWYLDNALIFITDGQQTVEEWKAHLAAQYAAGNPVTAVYALAEPIVTDVTHLFSGDNVLNVEEGGCLTFENEYKYDVPSSIEWRIESSHKIAFEHSQTIGNPHKTTAAEVGAYSKGEADSKFILLEDGKVPSRMLPSYVDDVLEYSSIAAFPEYGESGKIYIDLLTNKSYRWSGTTYVELTSSKLILGETSETAYRGDRGKIAYDHSQTSGNPHATTLNDILPVTEKDNDKILQVVGGAWTAVAIPNAEGGNF